jgi:hypothetical protein
MGVPLPRGSTMAVPRPPSAPRRRYRREALIGADTNLAIGSVTERSFHAGDGRDADVANALASSGEVGMSKDVVRPTRVCLGYCRCGVARPGL